MTAEKEYFIKLLSSYVNQCSVEERTVDFSELFRLAEIHDVGGIIANQLKTVKPEYQPDSLTKSHFNQLLGYAVKNDSLRESAFISVKDFLEKCECDYIFVKGINIRKYYPDPELRASGDIDVIVKADKLDFLKNKVKEQGIVIKGFTSETLTLNICSTEIEIHCFADVLSDYFSDIFYVAKKGDGFQYSLSEYDELLYVICHTAKHLTYTGAGVRMLLDIDLMIRGIEEFDVNKLLTMCKEAKIEKTAKVLIALCKLWFKTPVEIDYELDEEILKKLEYVFIDGGSFGYETNTIPTRYISSDSDNKLKVLLKMAFPSKEYLKLSYPYYKKHRILYPVARLNRLADGVFKKRNQTVRVMTQINSENNSESLYGLLEELELK